MNSSLKLTVQKRQNVSNSTIGEPQVKIPHTVSSGSLDDVFDNDIRPYIDIIDTMRKYGLEQDVSLPNVVVVGDQSSGKSSIIEVISGIQLPRGTGIVTRCPLELQLKKVSNQSWKSIVTYKDQSGKDIKQVTSNFEEVGNLIIKAQNDLCTTKKGVSKELITLRVESSAPNAPDLTLIDLPGISRTPVEDQPKDICNQIRKIIMEYVKSENTVILCVISGDLDIAVNESINIAQSVDPLGLRTIGVITKPDIADSDHKNEIIKMLDNKKIDLKKGFNLVKCRSSEQLKNKMPLSEFLLNEMEFYKNDDVYKHAKLSQLGAHNLSRKITVELVNVIKTTLPKLRLNIEQILDESQLRLSKLPKSIPRDDKDKRAYIMNITMDLNDKMRNFLSIGELQDCKNYHQTWRSEFDHFQEALKLKRKVALGKQFNIISLRKSIEDYRGKEISGFLSFSLFEHLIKPYIQSYKSDAINVLTQMGQIIQTNLELLFESSFSHLPNIEKNVKRILCIEYENKVKITEEKIDFIFKQEDIVFTMDSVFNKTWKRSETKNKTLSHFIFQSPITSVQTISSSETATSAEKMLKHIKCYLKIVHTRLIDNVPTAIMQCMLFQLHADLKNRLFEYLSSADIIEKIIENTNIAEERKNLNDKIARLKKGKEELHYL